jgi:ABC-type transport system involved in cytochrome bd biosynthesis fused ATPase/permease subunit
MRPEPDPGFDERIRFDRLTLREGEEERDCDTVAGALALVLARSSGRVTIRGGNGSGKSTLLAALKAEIKNRAYYWPTSDRLAFRFAAQLPEPEIDLDADGEVIVKKKRKRPGFSSGERQLRSLQEIVAHTDAAIYLLDEWDANLDAKNRAAADALVQELAGRARVVEISHRDRA